MADRFVAQVLDFEQMKDFIGAGFHPRSDMKVRPQGGARKKPGEDCVAAGGVGRAFTGQFRGDDAQMLSQLGQIPLPLPEDLQAGSFARDRIALTSEGLNQRGFSAAVGAEDGDVFARPDTQRDVVQHDGFATRDKNIFHVDKSR